MSRIFLDWAASAPPAPDLSELYAKTSLQYYGNPSSLHAEGKAAAQILVQERSRLAAALQVNPKNLVFTSGGTEASQIPILSLLAGSNGQSGQNGTILVSAIEHPAVYNQCFMMQKFGFKVRQLSVDSDGRLDLESFGKQLDPKVRLIAVMAVNNETGTIQAVDKISQLIGEHYGNRRPIFLCDTVQAIGKIPIDLPASGIDVCTISGHKLGAVRGCGALVSTVPFKALAVGGEQENSVRPGTENLAGIQSLAMACERSIMAQPGRAAHCMQLTNTLIEGIRQIDGAKIIPESRTIDDIRFSPFIISLAFPGLSGETMVRLLDDAGIAASTGSACSSRGKQRRILQAMGLPEPTALGTIRISIGHRTTNDEIQRFLEVAEQCFHRFKVG